MKNIFYRIYSAAFVGICLVPAVLTPFIKSDASKEKRELGKMPSVKTEDGKVNFDFFSEFETYFSEHFAFRQQLVNADSRLKTAVLGTSPNTDVIAGKDGWLFYGDTKEDFLRVNTLDERYISNIAHNLRLMEEHCADVGADFIFFSAPNKNSLYGKYMPFNFIPSDKASNYENLSEQLSGDGFYFDMKEALLGLNSPTPLYHKTDTHWNNFGAYAAHTMLMNRLGRRSCPTEGEWYIKYDRLGDLAAMIYPAEEAKDAQLHNDYEFTYEYTSRFRGLDDIIIDTACDNGGGHLLMYRDSYGEAILPYMAEVYETAEFSRAVPYRLDSISEGDTVIVELVERNLPNLGKYAPVMAAPVREIELTAAETFGGELTFETEQISGYDHIFGELPEKCFSGESHVIYVETGGKIYEAFSSFEDKLLKREGERSPYGFSLYLPEGALGGELTVIIANNDGITYKIDDRR